MWEAVSPLFSASERLIPQSPFQPLLWLQLPALSQVSSPDLSSELHTAKTNTTQQHITPEFHSASAGSTSPFVFSVSNLKRVHHASHQTGTRLHKVFIKGLLGPHSHTSEQERVNHFIY